MDEDKLRRKMMEFERERAELGLRAALPDDKRRRVWREPLTKYELHFLTFMREQGIMTAEDLAGAMDEDVTTTRQTLMSLIDRHYVKVISDKGYAKYKARTKDDLQTDTKESPGHFNKA
jgi:DNA-binding MarR family transcriptional regulator